MTMIVPVESQAKPSKRLTAQGIQGRIDAAGRPIRLMQYAGRAHGASTWQCLRPGCGYQWVQTASAVLRGRGCASCAGSLPVTESVVVDRLGDRPIELLHYAGTASGVSTWRCKVEACGHTWKVPAHNVLNGGNGCMACAGHLTISEDEARQRMGDRPIELVEYGGAMGRVSTWRCLVDGCGHEWESSADVVIRGGCGKCAGNLPMAMATVEQRLIGRPISLESYGGGSSARSTFKCTVATCGHSWVTSASHVLSNGSGCPACSNRLPLNEGEVRERIAARPIELVVYAGTASRKSTWRCKNLGCGHTWAASADNIFKPRGCPSCADYAVDPNAPTWLYVVSSCDGAKKVGITGSERTTDRLAEHRRQGFDRIDVMLLCPTGTAARAAERDILDMVKSLPRGRPEAEMPYGGWTETWLTSDEPKALRSLLARLISDQSSMQFSPVTTPHRSSE